MNKKELKVQLEHGNITREEYQRELDILEGKPNKKDSKEDKTAIYSSELKGNFQIGLGEVCNNYFNNLSSYFIGCWS